MNNDPTIVVVCDKGADGKPVYRAMRRVLGEGDTPEAAIENMKAREQAGAEYAERVDGQLSYG